MKRFLSRPLAMFMSIVIFVAALAACGAAEEAPAPEQEDWHTFVLICNEGNNNAIGDVGNTIMIFSVNPSQGVIKQVTLLWDIFITDEAYEEQQPLDQPFRDYGADKVLEVINENFRQDIRYVCSINYMNLAMLIDYYGGVYIDLSRADRNAINGLLGDKVAHMENELADLGLDASQFLELTTQYYLNDYGPDTHLSGMQSVAFGWLQYDSVLNCCMREVEVISQLFFQMSEYVRAHANIYTTETQAGLAAEADPGKRSINLDDISPEDEAFLLNMIKPIIDRSYTNLDDDFLMAMFETILRRDIIDRAAGHEGIDSIQYLLIPTGDSIAYEREINGIRGRVIDFPKNIEALDQFIYATDPASLIITK